MMTGVSGVPVVKLDRLACYQLCWNVIEESNCVFLIFLNGVFQGDNLSQDYLIRHFSRGSFTYNTHQIIEQIFLKAEQSLSCLYVYLS